MVFSPVQIYLDHPNWQQQSNPQQESQELPPPQPSSLPSPAQLGGGGTGTIRAGSMVDRARLAKLPLPEAGLKCPRCESTNTKFCYFNNYNLLQPRHFCKTCRRYWTRGGSLRNVPVGGGSRRNSKKHNKASKTSSTSKPISVTNDGHKGCNSNLTDMAFHNFAHQLVGSQSNFMPPFLQNPPQYNGFQTMMEGSSNSSQTDMGIHTSGGNSNSLLLNGGVDHWKLPLFGGLEPPIGLFPYQTDHQGLEDPSLMVRKSQLHPISSTSKITHLGPMKLEENQRLNILSRQFSGISENYHQQWGGNTWPEISGMNSSSINNFL